MPNMFPKILRLDIPLFPVGQCVATPNAIDLLNEIGVSPLELIYRHQHGDWGDLPEEDIVANTKALASGARLLSSYSVAFGQKVWVITEADRSVTTVLLPEDY